MYPVVRIPRIVHEPQRRSRRRSLAAWLTAVVVVAACGGLVWFWLSASLDEWNWLAALQSWWSFRWQESQTWFQAGLWSKERITILAGLGILLAFYILRRR